MIEVLVGYIASGKSTYCNQRAKEGWIIINDDAVNSAVHGGNYLLYDKSLKPLYKSIEDHILHSAVLLGKNIVIDRGVDVDSKSRRRWIGIASSLDIPISAVIFEVFPPEIHARRRTESDARGRDYEYWLMVVNYHIARYKQPTLEEGFFEIKLKNWA